MGADQFNTNNPTPEETPGVSGNPPHHDDNSAAPSAPAYEIISGVPDPQNNDVYDYSGGYDDYGGDYGDVYDDDYGDPRKKKKHGMPPEPPKRSGCRRMPLIVVVGCMTLCCLCCVLPMCVLPVAVGGIAAIASNSEASVSGSETLTIDADTPVNLTVDNPVGGVTIERGSSDRVQIDYTKHSYGWNNSRADRELDNIDVIVEQPEDNTIIVRVDTTRSSDSLWSQANNVDMTIRVPESVYLNVDNKLGSITVRNVVAESLDLKTTLGGIVFEGDLGDQIGETYNIETSTGAVIVRLPSDVYIELDARADVGDINVEDGFDRVAKTDKAPDDSDVVWLGTLGSGDESPPKLILRSNTGAISIEVR